MESATVQLHPAHTMATATVAPVAKSFSEADEGKDMSGINKATLVKSVDYCREPFSRGHLDIELFEQPMEEPWDLAMLVKKLNSSNWFCEVAEA